MKKLSLKSKKRILEIISLIFILSGFLSIIAYKIHNINFDKKEQEMIDIYFENQVKEVSENDEKVIEEIGVEKNKSTPINYNYIGVLEIPKIRLKRGFYNVGSRYNNIQ